MENYYFTFGCNSDKARKYVKITGSSWESARDMMFSNYGKAWAFQYDDKGFAGQVEEWGLTELLALRESVA